MNANENIKIDIINKMETFDQESAQRLRDLSEPLEDNAVIAWAEADIYQLLNPNLLVQEYRQSLSVGRRLGWIQALRNVFILLPVMVTWWGIARAVSGYHALLQEAPDLSSQPFLLLWQGGFEGQMWLTFEWLGYIDFGILLIVVAATLVEQTYLRRRSDQTEAQVRHFRSELSHFLADKSRKLNLRKQDILFTRQEIFVEAIQESITKTQQPLAQLAEQFKGLVEQFKGVLESIRAEHERMTQLASEKSDEIDNFRIFTKALGNGASEMTSAISALQNIYQELNQSMAAFPNSLLKVESKQSEIVIWLQNTMQEFERVIEVQHNLSSQWNHISEMGHTSNERLEQIIGVQKNWGQSLIEVQNKWQQSLDEQNKWQQNLIQVQKNSGEKLVQAQENAQQDLREGFEQLGEQFNDSLNHLNQTLLHLSTQSNSTLVQAESDSAADAEEAEPDLPTEIAKQKSDSADQGKEQELS
jgi:uncharacterized coiled-coil protein SlyX